MKCEQCGGELRLENERCPQCGSANPFYEEHRKHMEQYRQDYADTKQQVLTRTHRFTQKMVRIALIVILVSAELVLLVVGSKAETIITNYLEQYTVRHLDDYAALCTEYAEQRDYVAYEALYRIKGLEDYEYDYEELDDQTNLAYVLSDYAPSMQSLLHLAIDTPNITDDQKEKRIETIVLNLYFMHEWMEEDYGKDNELYVQTLEYIEAETGAFMLTYGGLEPEQALNYYELSYNDQLRLLKKGLLNDEE